MTLIQRLRLCRRLLGIKQASMARYLGIPQSTLSAYELGTRYPSRDRLYWWVDAIEQEIARSRLTP